MRCDEVMELIQRNLDGDLTNDEYEQFVDHLSTCSECRDLNDCFKQLSFDLETLPKVDPPFSLVDSILPQISLLPTICTQRKSKAKYWVMASSAAAIIAAVLVWRINSSQPTDSASMKMERSAITDTTAKDTAAKDTTAMAGSPQISTPVQVDKAKAKIADPVPTLKAVEKPIKKPTPTEASDKGRNTVVEKTEMPSAAPAEKQEVTAPVLKEEIVAMDKVPTNTSKENEAAVAASMAKKQASEQPTAQDQDPPPQRTLIASSDAPNTAAEARSIMGVQPAAQTYVSPDGRLSATAVDHVILVRNNKTEVQFQSHRFNQVDQVHIYWLDNQQLVYELKQANGVERWKINLALGKEQKE